MMKKIVALVAVSIGLSAALLAQPQRNRGFFSALTVGATSASSLATVTAVRGGSATYDPPSAGTGAAFATTMGLTGISTTSVCTAGHSSVGTTAYTITATAGTNTANVVFINQTGGTSDLSSGTLRVLCWDY